MKRAVTIIFVCFIMIALSSSCSNDLKEAVLSGGPTKKIVKVKDKGEWLLYGSNTESYRSTADYFDIDFEKTPTWTYDGELDGLHFINKGSPAVYMNYVYIMTSYYSGNPPTSTSNEVINSWYGKISDKTEYQSNLICIDRTNGSLKWIYPKPGHFPLLKPFLTPAISKIHKLVYVGTESMVFAVDLNSGELKWKTNIKSSLFTNHNTNSPILWQGIIAPDTKLTEYIFYGAQSINCIRSEDGALRWSTEVVQNEGEITNLMYTSSPVISSNSNTSSLYVADFWGKVYCYNIQNGKKRWAYNAGGSLGTTDSLLLYKNWLYYAAYDATKRNDMRFCCVDVSGINPTMTWSYSINFTKIDFVLYPDVSPCCLLEKSRDEALVYFGTKDGRLFCFKHMYPPSGNTGKGNVAPVWMYQFNGSIYEAPVIFGNQNLSIRSTEVKKPRLVVPLCTYADNVDELYIVDPFKSTPNPILWSTNLNEVVPVEGVYLGYHPLTITSPCIAGDSIYIACSIGVVHRFGP